MEAMYRGGRQFATRLSDLPTELVREVLERLVSNDAEAACVALTKFCSASRRTGRVCDDGVWASAYEELFAIEPDENPKAEFRSVCSDLSRLSDELRVDFMNNSKTWNALELNRARARVLALVGEGALTGLLRRRGATANVPWTDYLLADHDLRRSTYEDEEARARSALEHGADPNHVKHEEPIIVMAAYWGALAVVALLVAAGANIDAEDGLQTTALGWAIFKKNEAIVNFLLEQGARVRDEELGLAQRSNDDLIKELVLAQR